jgi:hypothetical protein
MMHGVVAKPNLAVKPNLNYIMHHTECSGALIGPDLAPAPTAAETTRYHHHDE